MSNIKNKSELVVFLDQIGQYIIARKTAEDKTHMNVEYPVIVNIVPAPAPQQGQLVANFMPVMFDLLAENQRNTAEWTYNKSAITISNAANTVSSQVFQRYVDMYNKAFGISVAAEQVATPSLF